MNRKEKLSYLAGLIDADGHIYCPLKAPGGRTKKYPVPTILVNNTNKQMLDWIRENIGGSIYVARKATKKWKTYFRWQVTGNRAVALGKELRPYIVIKQYQLDRII